MVREPCAQRLAARGSCGSSVGTVLQVKIRVIHFSIFWTFAPYGG